MPSKRISQPTKKGKREIGIPVDGGYNKVDGTPKAAVLRGHRSTVGRKGSGRTNWRECKPLSDFAEIIERERKKKRERLINKSRLT